MQVAGAVVAILLANQALFAWMKKLVAPSGVDAAQAIDAKAAADGAAAKTSADAAALINKAVK